MKKLLIIFFAFLFIFTSKALGAVETLIIFDSSVSMLDPIDGEAKYITAVKSAKKILKNIDPSMPVGLRIIGVNLDSSAFNLLLNPGEFCKSSKLLEPIKANNIQNINQSLDSVFPVGTTPLTYSLRTALENDFTMPYSLKHIILITDGAESCDEDPCFYIRELYKKRKDVKIDIIAIGASKSDLAQLKCISGATNGETLFASNASEIELGFKKVISKPLYNNNVNSHVDNVKPKSEKDSDIIYKNFLIQI